MDWALAIEINRNALLRLVSALFASVEITPGDERVREGFMLSRRVRLNLLRVLRPGESALRRLIVIAAMGLIVTLGPVRTTGSMREKSRGGGTRIAAFPLFDTRRSTKTRRRYVRGPGPRIWFFDERDAAYPEPVVIGPDDPLDSGRLLARLHTFWRTINDLEGQAKRLAKMRARRGEDAEIRPPMRTGRPPGSRAKKTHEVDAVLAECETLARRALRPKPPDTS